MTKTCCCNSFMWVWTKTLDSCFPQRLWPSLKFNALWKWLQLVAALQREGRREGGFIMHPNLLTLSFFLLRANSSPLSCTFSSSPLLLLLPSLPSISPLSCRQCEQTNCQSWKILSTSQFLQLGFYCSYLCVFRLILCKFLIWFKQLFQFWCE